MFLDAICSNKENRKDNIDSELNVHQFDTKHHNTETSLVSKDPEFCDKNYDIVNKKNLNATENITQRSPALDTSPIKETKEDSNRIQLHSSNKEKSSKKVLITDLTTHDTDVLFLCRYRIRFYNLCFRNKFYLDLYVLGKLSL